MAKPATPCASCHRINCTCGQSSRHTRYDQQRGHASARGYDYQWQRVRAAVFANEPLCRGCAAIDALTIATEVDHIIPLSVGGARLDVRNLQPLCHSCHTLKTLSEQGRNAA